MKSDIPAPARDFIDAADVKGPFLYRKDGTIVCYLRISNFNFDLLSHEEQRAVTNKLTAKFRDDRKDFIYCTYPREIDLDDYKEFLKDKYRGELKKIGRRHLLSIMLKQANYLSTSGNYEHQHFIRIWKYSKDQKRAEEELMDRIKDFKVRYEETGIPAEILEEKEILKLCNLFANATQANYDIPEDNAIYIPVMQL